MLEILNLWWEVLCKVWHTVLNCILIIKRLLTEMKHVTASNYNLPGYIYVGQIYLALVTKQNLSF